MAAERKAEGSCDVGIVGLGVMGRNLASSFLQKGCRVAGYDLKPEAVEAAAAQAFGLPLAGCGSLAEFAAHLQKPRRAILLVTAGVSVDRVLSGLKDLFEAGDIIIDCGNSYFYDTIRREKELSAKGIYLIDAGLSGGQEGALRGLSVMAGGDGRAWERVRNLFEIVSAKAGAEPCCARLGPGGTGHFVKMVHNGIEYAALQLIAEAYFLLRRVLGLPCAEIAELFEKWNGGALGSYLLEIAVKVLRFRDEDGGPLVEKILDQAGQKGTGRWAAAEGLALDVPASLMAEAVFARAVSAEKSRRVAASAVLPAKSGSFDGSRKGFADAVEKALTAFSICAYAQGFGLLGAASDRYGWELSPGRTARVWRKGCIIRARVLSRIEEAYETLRPTDNLLLAPYFVRELERCLPACRYAVSEAALCGVPAPCFFSALSYYDSLRSETLPANLIQAQRDFFGAHTYERNDRPGQFHTEWE